jgi:hypothetical protein
MSGGHRIRAREKKHDIAVIAERLRPILDCLNKDNISTKLSIDKEAGIIKIYSKEYNTIKKASAGLPEILELSYASVEHHPYAIVLYHTAEILKSILDGWDSNLSQEQISELSWRATEIKASLDRSAYFQT